MFPRYKDTKYFINIQIKVVIADAKKRIYPDKTICFKKNQVNLMLYIVINDVCMEY